VALFILADDLTGAADCAARCHQAGLAATVYLRGSAVQATVGAICCTSDSRHLDADLAARRVRALAAGLPAGAEHIWYKKIDSTLRGHIGQELDAMLEALGHTCALVCPAFPAQRRGLQAGYLVTTPAPARAQHLPTLLARQSWRQVAAVGLEDVRGGVDHLAGCLAAARAQGAELLVVDALTEADLQVVLEAAQQALPRALLCGSAGLAGAVASAYARQMPPRAGDKLVAISGAALLVIGSGSAMAHRQIDYVRRYQPIAALQLDAGIPSGQSGDLLLHLPAPPAGAALDGPAAREMAQRLAAAALRLIEKQRPRLLVLSGGDTAVSLLERMGVTELAVQRELLPGIPLTIGIDSLGRAYAIVLKAGNHGDEAALATLLARARMQHER
jgi:uncharacterized protein YgbK (DUF1537 family)